MVEVLNMEIGVLVAFMREASDEELRGLGEEKLTECLEAFMRHFGTPFNYVRIGDATRLRCMDQSQVPERFRFLFDERGILTGW